MREREKEKRGSEVGGGERESKIYKEQIQDKSKFRKMLAHIIQDKSNLF